MKNMGALTTLGQAIDNICLDAINNWDDTIPVKNISFESLDTVNISGKAHTMRDSAKSLICNRLGIPLTYLEKCPPELQRRNLEHWLSQEKNSELFVRFKGNDVRAFFTTRYKPLDNIDVAGKLRELGFDDAAPVRMLMNDNFMTLNVINPEKDFEYKGSKMQRGAAIGNSEVGRSSLGLKAFLYRLVCTNGAYVSHTLTQEKYRHTSHELLRFMGDAIENILAESGVFIQRKLDDAWTKKIPAPDEVFAAMNERYHLTEAQQKAAEWAWPQEQGDSMFHIFNTYTRAAQHPDLSFEDSNRMEEVGGMILARS